MKTAVVFVHGLFLNGAEFTLLRRRLVSSLGFEAHRFSYPTVRGSIAATLSQLTRFVGRDEDMATLEAALAQAQAGHGQVVGIVAPAGTGKSRLAGSSPNAVARAASR